MKKPESPPSVGEIIQTRPDFKWPACLLIVHEAREWGVVADMPMVDGLAELTGGHAMFMPSL